MGSLSRILAEAYVSVKGIFRYKGALFWIVVFPLLFYGLMVGIWGNPSVNPVKLGVYNADEAVVLDNGTSVSMGDILLKSMNESKLFKITLYSDMDSLTEAVKNGTVDVGLIIPANFTQTIFSMETPTLTIAALKTNWVEYNVQVTSGFISAFGDQLRQRFVEQAKIYSLPHMPGNITNIVVRWFDFIEKPLNVETETITPPLLATKEGLRAYYAIGIIGIETLFIGLSVGATSIIDMRREGTLKVILASPMRRWELLASFTLSTLVAVGISSIAIFLFSKVLGADYNISLTAGLTTVLLLVVGALFTIGLGLLLAPLAKSQEAAMAIVNMIAFPVMFLGGFTIPKFVLPASIRAFADIYPLSIAIEAIRDMLTYGKPPTTAITAAVPAIIATIIIYAVGLIVFNKLVARAAEE